MSRRPTRPVPYPAFDGSQHCAKDADDIYFPDGWEEYSRFHPKAREVCTGCPFFDACRDYAVSHLVAGIWAGTSANDRRKERARLGIEGISVSLPEHMFVQQLLDEVDDGVRNAEDVGRELGVSAKTVQRYRIRKAEQQQLAVA